MIAKYLTTVLIALFAIPVQAGSPLDCICKINGEFSSGSATMIAANDTHCLVLSCQHVGGRVGREFEVAFPGYNLADGVVVKVSREADLALLYSEKPGRIAPAKVGVAQKKNQPFYLMGYPETDRAFINWQKGSAVILNDWVMEVDCAPIPGMSGGPTFDARGYLVGIVVGYKIPGNRYAGVLYRGPPRGYVVPSGEILPFLFEFAEENAVSSVVPAALLAAALSSAPADAPRERSINAVSDPAQTMICDRSALFDRIRKNREQRSPRKWQKQTRRTQRITIDNEGKKGCPDGNCPDGGCTKDGQCPSPYVKRLDHGFKFEREGILGNKIKINDTPAPTDEPKDEGAPQALNIQVHDLEPEPSPEPEPKLELIAVDVDEHSIVVTEPEDTPVDDSTVQAGLAAVVGALVAAYQTYMKT